MSRFLFVILLIGLLLSSGCHHSVDTGSPSGIENPLNMEQLSAAEDRSAPQAPSFVDIQQGGDTDPKGAVRLEEKPVTTLPVESVFEIDGTFGCRVGMPYKVTITQKNDDIRYSAKVFFDEMIDEPVDCEKFKGLWAACEQANIESLADSYGEELGPADFHGTFTCRIQLGNRIVSKELTLTYGRIKDRGFDRLFDAIMETVPPKAHLPFYSIRTIDYSQLPLHAVFHLQGRQYNPSSVYEIKIAQEANAMHCRTVSMMGDDKTSYDKRIGPDEYRDFWKACSAVDLGSLADSYGDIQTYSDFQWDLSIEVETRNGRFTRDVLFANQKISDARFGKLVNLLLNLADSPVNIPLNEKSDKTTAQLNPL